MRKTRSKTFHPLITSFESLHRFARPFAPQPRILHFLTTTRTHGRRRQAAAYAVQTWSLSLSLYRLSKGLRQLPRQQHQSSSHRRSRPAYMSVGDRLASRAGSISLSRSLPHSTSPSLARAHVAARVLPGNPSFFSFCMFR